MERERERETAISLMKERNNEIDLEFVLEPLVVVVLMYVLSFA